MNHNNHPELEKKMNAGALACGIGCCIAGIALFIIQKNMTNVGLSYLLIFIGLVLLCYGAYMLICRTKAWYYKGTNSPTCCKEYFFLADDFGALQSALNSSNWQALKKLKKQTDSNVKLCVVSSKDGQFASFQLFRYQPFEFKPEGATRVLKDAEASAFINALK